MLEILRVHLPSWIIQDGIYPELSAGMTVAFAVRFSEFVLPLKFAVAARAETPRLIPVPDQDGAGYDAVGTVLHVANRWWAIDVGVGAYGNEPPGSARAGRYVRGKLSFEVDVAYADTYAAEPDAPALIYDWAIHRIERQMAPLIEVQPGLFGRDPSHSEWREVPRTRALHHDYGLAEYLLHCTPLGPPRKTCAP